MKISFELWDETEKELKSIMTDEDHKGNSRTWDLNLMILNHRNLTAWSVIGTAYAAKIGAFAKETEDGNFKLFTADGVEICTLTAKELEAVQGELIKVEYYGSEA